MSRISLLLLAAAFWIPSALSAAYGELAWTNERQTEGPREGAIMPSAQLQYDLAMKMGREKEYARAGREFQKIPVYFPDSPLAGDATYQAAICQYNLGNFLETYELLYAILLAGPDDRLFAKAVELQVQTAKEVLGQSGAPEGHRRRDYTIRQARRMLEGIFYSDPAGEYAPGVLYRLGLCAMSQGLYTTARKYFGEIQTLFPDDREMVDRALAQKAVCDVIERPEVSLDAGPLRQAEERLSHVMASAALSAADEQLSQTRRIREAMGARLNLIRERLAERIYLTALFYVKTGNGPSALRCLKEVTGSYPGTLWSRKAAEKLKELEPE